MNFHIYFDQNWISLFRYKCDENDEQVFRASYCVSAQNRFTLFCFSLLYHRSVGVSLHYICQSTVFTQHNILFQFPEFHFNMVNNSKNVSIKWTTSNSFILFFLNSKTWRRKKTNEGTKEKWGRIRCAKSTNNM